jgi:hypothetical protein
MAESGTRISSFEDLEVFQRAYEASLEIHKESLRFPKFEQYALGGSDSPGVKVDLRKYR